MCGLLLPHSHLRQHAYRVGETFSMVRRIMRGPSQKHQVKSSCSRASPPL